MNYESQYHPPPPKKGPNKLGITFNSTLFGPCFGAGGVGMRRRPKERDEAKGDQTTVGGSIIASIMVPYS